MNYRFLFYCLLGLFIPGLAAAQADLFGVDSTPVKKGFVIGVNGNFDIPGADMAKRFGLSYRLGPSLLYKTADNWMFGAKCDFIFGNQIREDSFLYNIADVNGYFINNQGQRLGVGTFERGYAIGLQAGKIFAFGPANPNSGLMLLTGVGFIQHKISIYDKDNTIPALAGDYKKGYDRLTNGIYVEQFAGYNHFSPKGFFNFHIGLDILAGFTACRRDYIYDIMRAETGSRLDLLFGLRGGWYIPLFKRKSEDYYFQ